MAEYTNSLTRRLYSGLAGLGLLVSPVLAGSIEQGNSAQEKQGVYREAGIKTNCDVLNEFSVRDIFEAARVNFNPYSESEKGIIDAEPAFHREGDSYVWRRHERGIEIEYSIKNLDAEDTDIPKEEIEPILRGGSCYLVKTFIKNNNINGRWGRWGIGYTVINVSQEGELSKKDIGYRIDGGPWSLGDGKILDKLQSQIGLGAGKKVIIVDKETGKPIVDPETGKPFEDHKEEK